MKKSQRDSNSNATKEYLSVVKPELCFSLILIEDPRRLQGYNSEIVVLVVLGLILAGKIHH